MLESRSVFTSVLSFVLVLGALSGCGSAAVHDRASLPQHPIDDAFESYQAELAEAAGGRYGSRAEAEALSRTLGAEARFAAHLTRALARYGLTRRGLGVHARQHPEFAARQEATNVPRMARLEALVDAVAAADVASASVVAFDAPDPASRPALAAR
jgi:hypothetical protein